MSSYRVQLNDPPTRPKPVSRQVFENYEVHPPRSKKPFIIVGLLLLLIAGAIGVVGLLYYEGLKETPQYSLALLVDAAKRDDGAQIDELVDFDNVVDDFVPQITDKAIDLYGRGQPPQVLARVEDLAKPLLPAVKERARAELPRVVRERTERLGYVPFSAMVLAADKYLDIAVTGDKAVVVSRLRDQPLHIKMQRSGTRWKVVGVTEEQLALDIARKIGQEIISIAKDGSRQTADKYGGMGNLAELMRQAEELVR